MTVESVYAPSRSTLLVIKLWQAAHDSDLAMCSPYMG